jgi:hypothetical protein
MRAGPRPTFHPDGRTLADGAGRATTPVSAIDGVGHDDVGDVGDGGFMEGTLTVA